jgi:uncharacterized membrane protein YraQ (UPF0718 family)
MSLKKQKKSFAFRGKYFFLLILISYSLFFVLDSQSALLALAKSRTILVKILPILAVVILFTALLNYLLKPRQIARHLGHESGIMGWLWALGAGVISHGPMYVWYPLLEDLRSHGMKDCLVVVFFASRTIKIPLLPIMVDYFGMTFTLVLSFYILVAAFLQGLVLEVLSRDRIEKK